MENLTHTLVGLMLARVGLEKTTPRGAGMMMLAANAPDIDAVFWFGGMLPYIEYHRSYTHSLAFMPLVALLPMLLVRARFSWRAFAASMAGVLSHLLLDWTNSYGIPLTLPFSAHRFRLDTVNLVDIWIWAILLGSLAAAALSRLVNREIGASQHLGARRGWAWAALLLLFAYDSGRVVAHDRAVNTMAAHLYQGAPPRRVTALPGAFNPLAWRGVVEGAGFTIILPVNLTGEYDPLAGRIYRNPAPIPAMDAALRTHPFAVFSRFAQLPFWKVTPVEDGFRLDFLDLRFGNPGSPGFADVTAIVDRQGAVLRSGFGL
jgi:inner membrane protein